MLRIRILIRSPEEFNDRVKQLAPPSRLRFAFLGACPLENVRAIREQEGRPPAGQLLVVHETSDDIQPHCAPWKAEEIVPPSLLREVILDTGLSHGFLFRPLPEWLEPVAAWAVDPQPPAPAIAKP